MAEMVTIDFGQPVPLFPLPNLVLLPHATVPLHIFEPRYQEMVGDALESRSLIAMALFEGQEWKQDYEGNPPLRPHVCVGYVVRHQRLPGGRYNLLLQGVCRAKIVHELPHHPYRQAMLEPLEVQPAMEIDLSDHRQNLEKLLRDSKLRQLAAVSTIHNWLSTEIPTAILIDLVIITLCDSIEQRYAMLAEPDATARAQWLQRQLRDIRRTLTVADRFQPPQSTDDVTYN